MKSSEEEIKEGTKMKKTDHNVLQPSIRHRSALQRKNREKIFTRLCDSSIEKEEEEKQTREREERMSSKCVCVSFIFQSVVDSDDL